VRLIKGSHIVVRKLFDHGYAYIFQNPDKRIIFVIPYERDYTLIGTTDVEYHADPRRVAIDTEEIRYLCEMASRYFTHAVTPDGVVWSYSGVRPLIEGEAVSASAATRDYLLELETQPAPLLNVWGGKITTFRKLAEEAVEKLQHALRRSAPAWTAGVALPGGECGDFEGFLGRVRADRPWLPAPLAARLARAYGARIAAVLGGAKALADLGGEVAPGLHEKELHYLIEHEWAITADDILWRRSKLGLHYSAEQRQAVADWIEVQAGTRREAA
jgi:glycerol-3-phosphate dehydrogenase